MLIGGEWVEAAAGERIGVEAPAQGEIVAAVPRGRAADVGRAVDAAGAAFTSWRRIPPRERGKMIAAVADDLEADIEQLARTAAEETGNAIRTQFRPEVRQAADFFRYFGGLASEFKGELIPHNDALLNYNVREPLGVVGGIVPWNSPAMLGSANTRWRSRPATRS